MLRIVSTLLEDDQLFAWVNVSLKTRIVLANNSLYGIIVAISNIISALRNSLRTLDVVGDQSETIRTQTLQHFSVELAIVVCAVVPWFFCLLIFANVFKVVIEEILTFDKLASVPLGNVTTLKSDKLKNLNNLRHWGR